jgi:hypothetical protein
MELCGRKLQPFKSPGELMDGAIDESLDPGPSDLHGRELPALALGVMSDASPQTIPVAGTSATEAFLVAHWLVGEGEG